MMKQILLLIFIFAACATGSFAQEAAATDSKEFEQFDFANGLFERGLYEMAIDEYLKYKKSYPAGQFLGEVILGIAESHYFNDTYNEAIIYFMTYLKAFPKEITSAMASLRLGQSYFFTGQFDEAVSTLNSTDRGKLDEKYHSTLDYYLGRTMYQKGELGLAIKYLSVVTQDKQKDAPVAFSYLLLGDIFLKQQQYEEAISNYLLASENSDEEKLVSLAFFRKAVT